MDKTVNSLDINILLQKAASLGSEYALKLVGALLVLFIGSYLIKILIRVFQKGMQLRKIDESLEKFLGSLLSMGLKFLLIITVAYMLGIQMASFVALLGAAGLAVGLALQGSLSNFAGGVLILFLRPFRVGDFIEAQGQTGTVKEIQIFNTILKTPDNKVIFIPNSDLSNGQIINYSLEEKRRVDIDLGIGYDDDIIKTKQVLSDMIQKESRFLSDPKPVVVVKELADSSVNLSVRAWCNTPDYWDIYFKFMEDSKLNFDKEGISIPFPQRDVHVYQHENK